MANKDLDFSDLGAEPVAEPLDFSDLGAIAVDEAPKAPKSISKNESFNAGIQQGATLGGAPILQGAIEGGLDAGQSLLAKLGLMDPSPSDINALMAQNGVKGDLGPQSSMDMYRSARDASTADFDAAAAANPGSYLAGNILGGVATLPMLPAKLVAPLGAAAKGAGIGAKMLKAAQNGIPVAALASANMSKGDLTKGEFDKVAADTVEGAALSIPLSAGLQGLGTGLYNTGVTTKNVTAKLIPQNTKDAFQNGLDKIDIKSNEFYKTVTDKLKNVVDKISKPLTEKSAAQQAVAKAEVETLEYQLSVAQNRAKEAIESGKVKDLATHEAKIADIETKLNTLKSQTTDAVEKGKVIQSNEKTVEIENFDNKLTKIKAEQDRLADLDNQKQLATNADNIRKINDDIVDGAESVQKNIFNAKNDISGEYEDFDKVVEATGVFPENQEVINGFHDTISKLSGLPQTEVLNIMGQLAPSLGEKSMQSYRNTKAILNTYSNHDNATVKRAAKNAILKLKSNFADDLTKNGYGNLADKLSQLNKRWSAVHKLEDRFVSNITPDNVTGVIEPSTDTINAIAPFGEKNAKDIANNRYMSKLLKVADPENAPAMINDMSILSNKALEAKSFKPVPLPENPEVARLQALLKDAKNTKIDVPTLPNPEMSKLEAELAKAKATSLEKPIALPDPEITRLENLLAQAKETAQASHKIPGLSLNADNLDVLNKQLTDILPKFSRRSGDDIAEKQLTEVLTALNKEKGSEFTKGIKSELTPLAKDVALRNINTRGDRTVEPTLTGVVLELLGGGAANIANKFGNSVKNMSERPTVRAIGAVKDFMTKPRSFLTTGVTDLSKASNEEITMVAEGIAKMGGEGPGFARVLNEAQGKQGYGRDAVMFGLMQRKEFRDLMNKLNVESGNVSEPVK